MKVGLWSLEDFVENTALMQISAYHKGLGDDVGWFSPLFSYDKVYVASLFDFTPKPVGLDDRFVCGGSGYDLGVRLPVEVEMCDLDYSIYPKCVTSYLWFSRGCFRDCKFCVVRRKERYIRSVSPKNLNSKGVFVSVMDNNFFGNSKWIDAVEFLLGVGLPVRFYGLDLRLMDDVKCLALAGLRLYGQQYFAWDNVKDDLVDKIELVKRYLPKSRLACYVLIGFDSSEDEDLYRVECLRDLGVDPFVMPYNKFDVYQRRFARWVNHKAIFKSVAWRDYCVA